MKLKNPSLINEDLYKELQKYNSINIALLSIAALLALLFILFVLAVIQLNYINRLHITTTDQLIFTNKGGEKTFLLFLVVSQVSQQLIT